MGRLRLLAAILIALAFALGGSGYMPNSVDGGGAATGTMAATMADPRW